jgi:hypothetical protein
VAEDQQPYADVQRTEEGFSIPELKWRELLFVGALRAEGEHFVRDPSRPLPPFVFPDLFPEGVWFRIRKTAGRVVLVRTG